MKFFSAFSGIGGFDLALTQEGFQCVGRSEIDQYADSVYANHRPGSVNYGDITQLDAEELSRFDLLVGGFPCQTFSLAGKRQGFDEQRGTLFFELARITESRRPAHLLFENVEGLLSAQGGYCFTSILSRLDELGYCVEWQGLNSKHFGVPQNRKRVFIHGFRKGSGQEIFPIREGPCVLEQAGKTKQAPSRVRREGVSPTVTAGRSRVQGNGEVLIGTAVTSRYGALQNAGETYVLSHSPRNGDPSRGGTGPLVSTEHCFTLDSSPHFVAPALTGGGKAAGHHSNMLLIDGLRRLTPVECERLQGFPDGWTEYGVGGKKISDSQRYKMLGNAVSVPVVKEIAKRLMSVTPRNFR